ncbi:MAG TPA: alkaline phosphatase D family protein [Paraburkholderia sp.]|jgi:alkaline phosphatase D|nr:alkaline phosphatase D family protein [Paraburkholderia sp.]
MDRRHFLKWSSLMTVSVASASVLSACGGDNSSTGATSGTSAVSAAARGFSLGVASGDPQPDSVVLWTRVDGGDGEAPVNVTVQVALDADFKSLVLDTNVNAEAQWDYTLRHKVTNLNAGTVYYYRFIAGSAISTAGRTWTTPAAGQALAQLRFAVICCQDWSVNHWAAFDAMQSEDLDFVVHVGNYVYEQINRPTVITPARDPQHGSFLLPQGAKLADGSIYANSVDDYRMLYKTYRSDPRLQRVHAKWPMIATWGDHEFSNDAWQDHATYVAGDTTPQTARRRNANQAWFEFMPADVSLSASDPSFQNIQIYRSFSFGNLATLVMTDERLYRADHEVAQTTDSAIGSRYVVAKSAVDNAEQARLATAGNALTPVSMLGDMQRQWWQQQMSGAKTVWKLWGNEVPLLRMQVDGFNAVVDALTQAVVSTSAALPPFETTLRSFVQGDLSDAVAQNLVPAPFTRLANFGKQAGFSASDIASTVAGLNQMLPPYSALTMLLLSADQWDGYNAERKNLMQFLASGAIANVVALSGNVNAFVAGTVMDDFDAATPQPVMIDLATAGISSESLLHDYEAVLNANTATQPWLNPLFAAGSFASPDDLLKSNNPWLAYTDTDAQGYTVVSLTSDQLSATFKKVGPIVGGQVPAAANAIASTQVVTVAANTVAVNVVAS